MAAECIAGETVECDSGRWHSHESDPRAMIAPISIRLHTNRDQEWNLIFPFKYDPLGEAMES